MLPPKQSNCISPGAIRMFGLNTEIGLRDFVSRDGRSSLLHVNFVDPFPRSLKLTSLHVQCCFSQYYCICSWEMAESAEASFFQHLLPMSSQQKQDSTNKRARTEAASRAKGQEETGSAQHMDPTTRARRKTFGNYWKRRPNCHFG